MPDIKIFVLDRGFVVIGRASIHKEMALHWRLEPGRTIRKWGTTKGLAQLKDGPLTETVLDAPANRSIPFRAVIEIIDVDQEKWSKHI